MQSGTDFPGLHPGYKTLSPGPSPVNGRGEASGSARLKSLSSR